MTINELITAVNIDLGTESSDACPALDCTTNPPIDISCLLIAVNNTLGGCAQATPTPAVPIRAIDLQVNEAPDQENGLSFATRFHAAATQPTIPVIIPTAFGPDDLTRSVAAAAYLSLLRKPVHYDDVRQLLHHRV